jgi:hypothetical protein
MSAKGPVSPVTPDATHYPENMTIEQAAAYLGAGESDFQARVRADLIPHIHTGTSGGRVIIHKTPLDLWKLVSSIDSMAPSPVRDLMLQAAVASGATPTTGR